MRSFLIAIVVFFALNNATVGQKPSSEITTLEIHPPYGVIFILAQNDSPVSITEAQLFTDRAGSFPQLRYVIKNRTAKEIRSVTIEFFNKHNVKSWSKNASGWSDSSRNLENSQAIIGPYGTYENIKKRHATPLESSMISEFDDRKTKGEILGFWAGYVSRVVFMDGREYSVKINGDDLLDLVLGN